MNTQELQETRDNNARRNRERRNRLTAQRREQHQQADAAQHQIACAELTPEQQEVHQQQDASQRRVACSELTPDKHEVIQQQDASQRRLARSQLTPEQRLLIRQEDSEQHQFAHSQLSPQELELYQQRNAAQMRNGRASQESNNDNDPILNSAGEPFSIRMYSFPEDPQLVGWEKDASKALMMFHETNLPHTHDLMDKMRTEGPSAPDGPPNKSEQIMIDTLKEMKITPEKQRHIQRTFNSIHDRHARIIGCCVCGIRCILPTVTAEGALIPPPVLKVFPTDPLFGPLKFDDEQMREWHLLDPIKQKVRAPSFLNQTVTDIMSIKSLLT